jgi:protein translocase SecG subunit
MVNLFTFLLLAIGFFIIILVLLQQGKGGIGLAGTPSKGSQVVFGGSGGHDFFAKATWILGFCFLFFSLVLARYQAKNRNTDSSAATFSLNKSDEDKLICEEEDELENKKSDSEGSSKTE